MCRGEERFVQVLSGNTEGKKTFGVSGRRREGNLKMELSEIGWRGLN